MIKFLFGYILEQLLSAVAKEGGKKASAWIESNNAARVIFLLDADQSMGMFPKVVEHYKQQGFHLMEITGLHSSKLPKADPPEIVVKDQHVSDQWIKQFLGEVQIFSAQVIEAELITQAQAS